MSQVIDTAPEGGRLPQRRQRHQAAARGAALALALALALVLALLLWGAWRVFGPLPAPRRIPESVPASASTLVEPSVIWRPAPSIVGVQAFVSLDGGAGIRLGDPMTQGTGTVVGSDGTGLWVATAAHVVEGANAVLLHVPGETEYKAADRVWRDPDGVDLALVHVRDLPASPIELAPSTPPPDAWAGEVECVRWPGWTFQSFAFPFDPGGDALWRNGARMIRTPGIAALPGCSGGPVVYYRFGSDRRQAAGILTAVTRWPDGIVYIPAGAVRNALAQAAGKEDARRPSVEKAR